MAEAAILRPAAGSALLPRRIAGLIFEDAAEQSVVQQLARRVPLTQAGVAIPYFASKPVAAWVGEGGRKPVSDSTLGTKTIDPKKLAVIVPFSKEYLDGGTEVPLFDVLRPEIAGAFAEAFDRAALHGTSTPFTNYVAQTTNSVELGTGASHYVDLVSALGLVVGDGYRLTGWAASPSFEVALLGDVDGDGRPIMVESTREGAVGTRILGRPAVFGDSVYRLDTTPTPDLQYVAFGGDWRMAAWGQIGDITYDVSREATLTLTDDSTLNLWQDNLVALLAETYYGWAMRDVEAFVEITEAVA